MMSSVCHISSGDRTINRSHPYDDRYVGCRAVAAETRRQTGWRDLPLGGMAHSALSFLRLVLTDPPRIPRIALLVLGALKGRQTSRKDARLPFDPRRSIGGRAVAGSLVPEGECKTMRGNNQTDSSVRGGHGRKDVKAHDQRA